IIWRKSARNRLKNFRAPAPPNKIVYFKKFNNKFPEKILSYGRKFVLIKICKPLTSKKQKPIFCNTLRKSAGERKNFARRSKRKIIFRSRRLTFRRRNGISRTRPGFSRK